MSGDQQQPGVTRVFTLPLQGRVSLAPQAPEEEACLETGRWLFCDTTPLTTWFYCLDMFGRAEPELAELASRPYRRLFLCAPDFDFVQDGTRQDDAFRARQHTWYQAELARRGMAYEVVSGPLRERVAVVKARLEA